MPFSRGIRGSSYYIALFAMLIALMGNITVWTVNKQATDKIRDTRVNGRLFFCNQIEQLKTSKRAEATKSYDDLDKNARLLHLEVTDELRATALRNRDRILVTYAAIDCQKLAHSGDNIPATPPPTGLEP